VRGAFTGANTARPGLFVQASGGTLFLDEIGDLPLALQPKLLRALQERAVRPVGSNAEVACDVRIVAATNRDLEAAVEEGRLREDLYFRINVVRLELPPLRSRGNDVLLLAQHFLAGCAAGGRNRAVGLSVAAAKRLLAYPWPGNVRELQNCMEQAVALARDEQIAIDDLPEAIRSHRRVRPDALDGGSPDLLPLEDVERRHILRVLDAVAGNKTLAAQILRLDRKTLRRKLGRLSPA
jgi:two-component system response regulator HydG